MAEIKRWWDRLDDLPTPPKVMSAMDKEIEELRSAHRKAVVALTYYRDECSGHEPSLSVFHQMLEEAIGTKGAQ